LRFRLCQKIVHFRNGIDRMNRMNRMRKWKNN
jgi:hypothetical protein